MSRKTKAQEVAEFLNENKAFVFQIETGLSDKFRVAVISSDEQVAFEKVKRAYPNTCPVLVATARKIITP
jgi:hypothetical protein